MQELKQVLYDDENNIIPIESSTASNMLRSINGASGMRSIGDSSSMRRPDPRSNFRK